MLGRARTLKRSLLGVLARCGTAALERVGQLQRRRLDHSDVASRARPQGFGVLMLSADRR